MFVNSQGLLYPAEMKKITFRVFVALQVCCLEHMLMVCGLPEELITVQGLCTIDITLCAESGQLESEQ